MALARVVQPLLLTDRVFDQIHAAIMSGELAAGTPLRVRDLAAQVGTSVMPVREAIRRLEESGLAVREPHKGAVVRNLSVDELAQTYDVRILLESEAARLGAVAATPAVLARMRRSHAKILAAVAAGRLIEGLDHDEAMLTALYGAAGNTALMDSIRTLWQRCRPYKIRSVRRTGDPADHSAWDHQALLITAAEHGDGDAAARITRESLEDAQRHARAELQRT